MSILEELCHISEIKTDHVCYYVSKMNNTAASLMEKVEYHVQKEI